MPKKSNASKASLAALGSKLVAATMHEQHRSAPPIAPAVSPSIPATVPPTAAAPAGARAEPPKKVCYKLDSTLAKRLVQFKLGLSMHGVTRKVNDTQVSLFALNRLPVGEELTPELAEEYTRFIEQQFPQNPQG